MTDDNALWQDAGSVFRPSYSSTWMNCAGSLRPSQFAADSAGIDAAVGTVFHWLMAAWQTDGQPDWLDNVFTVDKEDGSERFEITIDEDMFVHGAECLARFADVPGVRYIETRVDISSITPIPNQGGTADLAICGDNILTIVDWKYGLGVQVFAFKNSQILCYAWGFFQEFDWIYDFQTIRMWIAQPRLGHFDLWEISRAELLAWAEWAKARAYAAWARNAPRTPSPKACQWCKVRTTCPALEATRQSIADETFEETTYTEGEMKAVVALNSPPKRLPEAIEMPTAQLERVYGYRKLMENWFTDIGEELITRGCHGEQLEGWKIVQGRSRRRYRDEQVAVEKLCLLGLSDDEIHTHKLLSPNQLKKVLRAVGIRGKLQDAFIRTLVYVPPGRLTLVPDGDNRSEVPSLIDDTFESEEDDNLDDEAAL